MQRVIGIPALVITLTRERSSAPTRPHFLREVGMANHSDSQIGIQFSLMHLA